MNKPIMMMLLLVGLGLPGGAVQAAQKATFAGGCFWCMESDFQKIPGVQEVVSGYTGGEGENPTYEDYASTGHIEAIQVTFDPSRITYQELLNIFWVHVDPIDTGGQFCDRGHPYSTAIFYHSEKQRQEAEKSKAALERSRLLSEPIFTPLLKANTFYPAEDYHQNYAKRNPLRYKFYRFNCGRDSRLEDLWGKKKALHLNTGSVAPPGQYNKPSQKELEQRLSPLQYKVTQKEGTEPPFNNAYWDNKKAGIYVDIVSGEPLFSSLDKYTSGTGWPSFIKPLEPTYIVEKEDRSLFSVRTEVRSSHGDSHLGHVFEDGPEPTGLRYCINSAALRFIPVKDLEKEGYGEYTQLFQ